MTDYGRCAGCGAHLDPDDDATECGECREDFRATPYPTSPLPADDDDVIPFP